MLIFSMAVNSEVAIGVPVNTICIDSHIMVVVSATAIHPYQKQFIIFIPMNLQ